MVRCPEWSTLRVSFRTSFVRGVHEKIKNISKLFADDSKIISVIKEQTDVDR